VFSVLIIFLSSCSCHVSCDLTCMHPEHKHKTHRSGRLKSKRPSVYTTLTIFTLNSPSKLRRFVQYLCNSTQLINSSININMSKIPGSAHLNLTLGGLVMAGGAAGYMRKGSKASLLAGVTFGTMYIGSGYLIAFTDNVYKGHVVATTASGVMALAMGQRYVKTHKIMPAGLLMAVGAAACAYNYTKMLEWAPGTDTASSK
jgi:uncharacterized membrane protein (UPF0136 family)